MTDRKPGTRKSTAKSGKKLRLSKQTLKDLSPGKGAVIGGKGKTAAACSDPCPTTLVLCIRKTTVPAGCPSTISTACGLIG